MRAITVPMEAYLRGLSQLKTYANKTAIFLFFEDSGVTSILYKNGVYLYSTRSRIFSERGTLDFGTEIVRNISGIIQFYATTTSGIPITDIYYAGCMEDDFEVCLDGIHMMNLQAALLQVDAVYETQGNPEDWLVCAGALVDDKTKQVNLYQKWKKSGGMDKVVEKESFVKHIVPPVITLAVCMALFGAVSVWNLLESKKIDDINDWINDSQIQQQYQEADEVMKESERLVEQKQQVEQMKQNLATYPDLDADIIARIVDVSGSNMNVEVKSMDAETGLLTFHAVSSAVIDIPDYTAEEKKIIFSRFALPKVLKRMGLKAGECVVAPDGLDAVVEFFAGTSGIRDLEQAAEHIAANALYQIEVDHVSAVVFDREMVMNLLG